MARIATFKMPARPDRLGEQIRAELCLLLQRWARDPVLRLTTVTHVRLTRDLQHARVYYTVLGDMTARRHAGRGLRRAASFLRGQLGRRLRFRHVPDLTFTYDDSLEREERIAQILEEFDLPPAETDDLPAQSAVNDPPTTPGDEPD